MQMQSVSLTKGQNISLTKNDPGLQKIKIGLGWKANAFDGAEFDLDASAIMITASGKVRTISDFIFYGQEGMKDLQGRIVSPCKSVIHHGDNKTGNDVGDAESLEIDLKLVPADIDKIVFTVSIYLARGRKQNFGMVQKSYIRLENAETNQELTRYDLTEDFSTNTALVFGELYRSNSEWKFKATGQGFNDGLAGVGRTYGLPLEEEQGV